MHSIGYVPVPMLAASGCRPLRQLALTKRRAVDFCRVSTALCPASPMVGICHLR